MDQSEIDMIKSALSARGFDTNLHRYNAQYAAIPDDLLLDFVRLRLKNDGWGAPINTLEIIEKKNNPNEYFYVRYVVNKDRSFEHESGIMFKKFYTNEVDWLSECFDLLHFLPMSEYIFRKKNEITNLECSNRGWQSAHEGLKERLKELVK